MSEDAVRKYQDALEALSAAHKHVETLRKPVVQVGQCDWESLMVSNISVGFPAEIAFRPTCRMDAREWPTAQQIAEALVQLHTAHNAAKRAHDALAPTLKQVVTWPQQMTHCPDTYRR